MWLKIVSIAQFTIHKAIQHVAACLAAQVWAAAEASGMKGGETGSVARLHSALMAVMTHLVVKLGGRATSAPELQACYCYALE